jgi:hypothetical protein
LKVPDTVEVSMRQNGERKIYFLLNHQNSHVRLHFYKPMHDFLTGQTFTGNYDLPSHGVLVLDELVAAPEGEKAAVQSEGEQPLPIRIKAPAETPAPVAASDGEEQPARKPQLEVGAPPAAVPA